VSGPFDDPDGRYLVLATEGGAAHCLWPAWAEPPAGWAVIHGPAARAECLDAVEAVSG
jgi:MbtH protein